MIDVILYGDLGKKYGKNHRYSVSSVPEAIRALNANFKGFVTSIDKEGKYRVIIDKEQVSEDQLHKTATRTIKIVPVVQGGGNGGLQVVLGIALIIFAWWNPYSWGVAAGATGAWSAGVAVGASLVLGGVSQMMMKTPQAQGMTGADRADQNPSYMFDGPVNTAAQGNPVPLAYGEILAGSQVISAGLEAV